MRLALLSTRETLASGPDLTRYLVVCGLSIAGLLALAWVLRRFLTGHLKARAARRSLQVLDVLPLSGKQKLVVVRCYDRNFLLGVGDREVRAIAELEAEAPSQAPATASAPETSFAGALASEIELLPAKSALARKGGVLA